jgi:antitoxin Phd
MRALHASPSQSALRPVCGRKGLGNGEDGYQDGYLQAGVTERYSIAQARDQLPRLVHHAEAGRLIELTRRGKPVAVLLSMAQYEHFAAHAPSFWDAVVAFRLEHDLREIDLGEADFRDLRDPHPGRDLVE